MVCVEFADVGRGRQTWRANMAEVSDDTLLAAIRERGALISRNVYFSANESQTAGQIFAGFHDVGRWHIVREGEGGANAGVV